VSVYWDLVEILYEKPDNKLSTDYMLLGRMLNYSSKKIKKIVENFELFEVDFDEKFFHSTRINNAIKKMQEEYQKRSNAGKKGAYNKWRGKKADGNANGNANGTADGKVDGNHYNKNMATTKECVTQGSTLNLKHPTPSVVCNAHTQDFWSFFEKDCVLKYPQDFYNWFLKYRYSPYSDSAENSFEEWLKLSDADRQKCLELVEIYVSLRDNPNKRHNPVNYLKNRIFDIPACHKLPSEVGDTNNLLSGASSRKEKDLERKFGKSQTEQEAIRNKTKNYDV